MLTKLKNFKKGWNEVALLTWPCVNWVSWAMVSFTCPCWGRGDCEVEDCRFVLDVPEVNPFCPGAEETALGAEMAVETGCPLMIWVTTCWGAPTHTANAMKAYTSLCSILSWNIVQHVRWTYTFQFSKTPTWYCQSKDDALRHIPPPRVPPGCQWTCFHSAHWHPFPSSCYLQ